MSLPDLSLVPISFLTEIQHDQVYETILEELRKKIPHRISPKPVPIQEEEEEVEERKPFSPRLFAIDDDDDDDDISIADEVSSSTSSEHNETPLHEDYDTDIEPG